MVGIDRLGRLVRTALKDVLDAFADGDVAKAHDVWERDEEIDQVYTGLFRELLTYMMEDPRTITARARICCSWPRTSSAPATMSPTSPSW